MTDAWTTPERVALRRLARDFTEREIVPNLAQWEADGEVPRSLHLQAAETPQLRLTVADDRIRPRGDLRVGEPSCKRLEDNLAL